MPPARPRQGPATAHAVQTARRALATAQREGHVRRVGSGSHVAQQEAQDFDVGDPFGEQVGLQRAREDVHEGFAGGVGGEVGHAEEAAEGAAGQDQRGGAAGAQHGEQGAGELGGEAGVDVDCAVDVVGGCFPVRLELGACHLAAEVVDQDGQFSWEGLCGVDELLVGIVAVGGVGDHDVDAAGRVAGC